MLQLRTRAKLDATEKEELRRQNNQFRLDNDILRKLHWTPENPAPTEFLKTKWKDLPVETQLAHLEYHEVHRDIWAELVFESRGKNALKEFRQGREKKKLEEAEQYRKDVAEGKKPAVLKPAEIIYSADPGENKAIKAMMKSFKCDLETAKKMVEGMKK